MLLLGFANDSNHWRFTHADGSSVETPPTVPGLIVLCSDPVVHMGENLASVRQQGIRFELKNQPMGRPYCPPPPG